MRFEAMHTFTSKLPLVKSISKSKLIGDSTESCMQSGVMNGVLAEVNEIIQRYKDLYPDIRVILSGGDHSFFENNLKHPIFVAPDLVFDGLNGILLYHVEL
jgi:type III pantothenate kinase